MKEMLLLITAFFLASAAELERRDYDGFSLKISIDPNGLHQTAPMGHLPWVLIDAFPPEPRHEEP